MCVCCSFRKDFSFVVKYRCALSVWIPEKATNISLYHKSGQQCLNNQSLHPTSSLGENQHQYCQHSIISSELSYSFSFWDNFFFSTKCKKAQSRVINRRIQPLKKITTLLCLVAFQPIQLCSQDSPFPFFLRNQDQSGIRSKVIQPQQTFFSLLL